MPENFSEVEKLLGLPAGSTPSMSTDVLARAVVKKGAEVLREGVLINQLSKSDPVQIAKTGNDLDTIRERKNANLEEAFQTLEVAKAMRTKFMCDLNENLNPSDKMYAAGAAILTATMGIIEKLAKMLNEAQKEMQIEKEIEERNSGKYAEEGMSMSVDDLAGIIESAKQKMKEAEEEQKLIASNPLVEP